jgi:hypothetical protein
MDNLSTMFVEKLELFISHPVRVDNLSPEIVENPGLMYIRVKLIYNYHG